jgi:2-hydroxychromene-2-carboxylate isomerase
MIKNRTQQKSIDQRGFIIMSAEENYRHLAKAVSELYYAANWTPDRDCPAIELWTAVRDAAGLEPGKTAGTLGSQWKSSAAPQKAATTAEERYQNLAKAVSDLYYAANWTPDRDCEAVKLWTNVRDAAGLTPGQTAKKLGPSRPHL